MLGRPRKRAGAFIGFSGYGSVTRPARRQIITSFKRGIIPIPELFGIGIGIAIEIELSIFDAGTDPDSDIKHL